jgi:putative ABC transport system permease protein
MAYRQLLFRWRQHLLAVVGAGIVFAVAILATGMSAGFGAEAERMVAGIGGDGWVISTGTAGPFSGEVPLDQSAVSLVGAATGVRRAEPILILHESVVGAGHVVDAVVVGHGPAQAEPAVAEGRSDAAPGEAVVDRSTGMALGSTIDLGGRSLRVVGRTGGRTVLGGTPVVFVPLPDAQRVGASGAHLISAVVVTGEPVGLPSGLRFLARPALTSALLRPMRSARGAIAGSRVVLWATAAVIVACVTYMAAIEEVRDFAVLKAVGAQSRALARGLAAQAVIVTLLAGLVGLGLARLLRPGLGSFPVEITGGSEALVPVVAVVVGTLASLAGIRRALHTDPAVAFGGAG